MLNLPHITFYHGEGVEERLLNELSGDFCGDVWCLGVSPLMTIPEWNNMWAQCLGENTSCCDDKPRQCCAEAMELVYFNTGLLINEIGNSFGVGHIPTPAYVEEQRVRGILQEPAGVRQHLLPHLMAGKQVILYFSSPAFRVTVYKSIPAEAGGGFLCYTMYMEQFRKVAQPTTPNVLDLPFVANPGAKVSFRPAPSSNKLVLC